ncbi:MAG: dienelactone hydrolase family protein, partial [Pseudomonadota bacterium]
MRSTMLVALTAGTLLAVPAAAETVRYTVDGADYDGYLALPEGDARGLIVIIHDWDGLGAYEERRAEMLAELGYAAFAVDLFGAGNRPDTMEGRRAATGALYADREAMRARIEGGLAVARERVDLPAVVMGYCFGGAATLEQARAGEAADIVGYASFHGGLATPEGQSWEGIETPVLILHGGADQNPSMADVEAFATELEATGTPYEIQIYSG